MKKLSKKLSKSSAKSTPKLNKGHNSPAAKEGKREDKGLKGKSKKFNAGGFARAKKAHFNL